MTSEVLDNGVFILDDQEFSDRLIAIRRHLHAHPEIGLQEFKTSAFIRELLSANGLSVSAPLARTGLFVDIEGAFPGPKLAYRSDIDALPITDTKTVSYRSQNEGVAHLCGHDAHTTIGIAIASLLHARRHQMHGSVRVFFQPNEEGIPSGAPLMIGDGVLEGVEAVYASHVDPTLPSGVYGLKTGACTASADRFRIRVLAGSTGHSARPHQATDTIWISTQIMSALYQLVGRVSDARSPAVISICRLKAGEAYNVLPAEAEFGGTFRCTEGSVRASLKAQMEQTACGIGQTFGAEVLVDFDHGAPPVINDADLISTVRESILNTVGKKAIFDIPVPSMGGEDFAHYLDRVPGALVRVGTCNGPDTAFVLHDSNFDIDESVLAKTAQMWADTLIFYLQKKSSS
ncbi:MAG: amidohydrolase [Bacteroidetes bacterium]|nr:amidohydrolase [Bacteroidota bacterium]